MGEKRPEWLLPKTENRSAITGSPRQLSPADATAARRRNQTNSVNSQLMWLRPPKITSSSVRLELYDGRPSCFLDISIKSALWFSAGAFRPVNVSDFARTAIVEQPSFLEAHRPNHLTNVLATL